MVSSLFWRETFFGRVCQSKGGALRREEAIYLLEGRSQKRPAAPSGVQKRALLLVTEGKKKREKERKPLLESGKGQLGRVGRRPARLPEKRNRGQLACTDRKKHRQ